MRIAGLQAKPRGAANIPTAIWAPAGSAAPLAQSAGKSEHRSESRLRRPVGDPGRAWSGAAYTRPLQSLIDGIEP